MLSACGGSSGSGSGSQPGAGDNNNQPPVISALSILPRDTASLALGSKLSGDYQYLDADGDIEGQSQFRWFLMKDGEEQDLSSSASLTLTHSLFATTIYLEVKPFAATGVSQGTPAVTSVTLPARDVHLFSAENAQADTVLYLTDGTEGGTQPIKNFGSAEISRPLANNAGQWVFMHQPAGNSNNNELWLTDGTEQGTVKLENAAVPFSNVRELTKTGDLILFSASSITKGNEPWILQWANGEPQFTALDVAAEARNSDPVGFVYAAETNDIFFSAIGYDAEGTIIGRELHKIDLDSGMQGELVKDIRPVLGSDTVGSAPLNLTWFKDKLYFSAWDGSNPSNGGTGRTLWVSDGTSEGTQVVQDLETGVHSYPAQFVATGNDLYFINNSTSDTSKGRLWVTRGTAETTNKARIDLFGEASYLTAFSENNSLIFSAKAWNNNTLYWQINSRADNPASLNITSMDDSHDPVAQPLILGKDLYYANATSSGSGIYKLVRTRYTDSEDDLRDAVAMGEINDASTNDEISDLVYLNGRIIFSANGGQGIGQEVYYLDVNKNEGPKLLKDLVAGSASSNPVLHIPIATPTAMLEL